METNKEHSKSIFTSLSILVGALLISIAILTVGGGMESLFMGARKVLPKTAKFTSAKEISGTYSLENTFTNQPTISYKGNGGAKYLFVEFSDFDCINCANFHGYNTDKTSTFNQILDNYVELGKMDYIWMDNQFLGDIKKHVSFYCVNEQNSKKSFEYKEALYENYSADKAFNLDKAKNIAKPFKIDEKKFEECYNSTKYDERIKKLTAFANSLNVNSTPTFLIFEMRDVKTKKENQEIIVKQPFLVKTINGNNSFETFKFQLDSILNTPSK